MADRVSLATLALAKAYTDESIAGAGAIKGKNCEIQSVEPITGGNRVTFAWYDGQDVIQTTAIDVMDGEQGEQGIKGDKGDKGDTGNGIANIQKTSSVGLVDTYTITMTDGTSYFFTVTNGSGGGSNVVPNPEGEATDDLSKVSIDGTIYSVAGAVQEEVSEILDGQSINSFGDVETALNDKADTSSLPDIGADGYLELNN